VNNINSCRACHYELLYYLDLPTNSFIISDCSRWNGPNPQFYVCNCGYVGKLLNDSYKNALDRSYENYDPYWQNRKTENQETVSEQKSLDPSTKKLLNRSDLLVKYLIESSFISLKTTNPINILEYGCGNGPFIDALTNSEIKNYLVDAADLNDSHYEAISKKNKFRRFYNLVNQEIDQAYDLITLVHVLEHVNEPIELLNDLSKLLTEDGKILLQIPNALINPFDFIIADHLSHFNLPNIINLIRKSNLELLNHSVEVIPKEITLLLGKKLKEVNKIEIPTLNDKLELPKDFIYYYENIIDRLRPEQGIIIYGTSIGALWLTSVVEQKGFKVSAYLDEDENRVGNNINSVKIMHPKDFNLLEQVIVLIPLAPILAAEILKKYPKLKPNIDQGV
jgi:2-polyprenyl-3-methyl-5-hydroxy-6-metoxy-1,4-benzoquinol methylase